MQTICQLFDHSLNRLIHFGFLVFYAHQSAHAAVDGERDKQSDVVEGRLPFERLPAGGTATAKASGAVLDGLDTTIQMLELLQQLSVGLILRIIVGWRARLGLGHRHLALELNTN